MRPSAALLFLIAAGALYTQTSAPKLTGEEVYRQRCAGCHDRSDPRIPPRSALGQMPAGRILHTLDFGAMMTVAYPMSRGEREAVASYLGTSAAGLSFPPNAYCADRKVVIFDETKHSWNGWSPGADNSRHQSADGA